MTSCAILILIPRTLLFSDARNSTIILHPILSRYTVQAVFATMRSSIVYFLLFRNASRHPASKPFGLSAGSLAANSKNRFTSLSRMMSSSSTTATNLPSFGDPSYGITKKVPEKDLDQVVDRVTDELKKNGFGVLTKIDIRETLKNKLDVNLERPYVILGACNPKLAHTALQNLPSIGLFLPCNVVVAQDPDESIVVSAISPSAMFAVVNQEDQPSVKALADNVEEIMNKVMSSL